jgi:hypothetical protein
VAWRKSSGLAGARFRSVLLELRSQLRQGETHLRIRVPGLSGADDKGVTGDDTSPSQSHSARHHDQGRPPTRRSGRPWRAGSAAVMRRVFGHIRRDPCHRPGQYVTVVRSWLTVDRFEQVLWEDESTPPAPAAKLHVRRVKMDAGQVDEDLVLFNPTVLPDMKATPGFLAVRLLIQVSVRVRDTSERSGPRPIVPSDRHAEGGGTRAFGRIPSVELGDDGYWKCCSGPNSRSEHHRPLPCRSSRGISRRTRPL